MNFLEKIFEDADFGRSLRRALVAIMAVLVVADVFIHRHHEYFLWDKVPGFNAVIGLVACVLIIYLTGALGRFWLQKGEDYYDKD